MRIYLIRHGETKWNKEGRLQGSSDIPLNEYGKELARITAKAMREIPLDAIYTSPLIRARQTAEIMAEGRDVPMIPDSRLSEICFGQYEGELLKYAQKDKEHPLYNFLNAPEQFVPLGGESFQQVMERAGDFIQNELIPRQEKDRHIMLSSHGGFIRCFIRCIEKRPLSQFWKGSPQRNCAVSIVDLKQGRLTLLEEGRLYYAYEPEPGRSIT